MTTEPIAMDTPFRCQHYACTLSTAACLRRQSEIYRKPGKTSTGRRFVVQKPMHPHCGGGTCEQGNSVRKLFPGYVPDTARLDLVNPETTMPKTPTHKPGQGAPCTECGSTSRHKKGCSKPPRASSRSPGAKRNQPVRLPSPIRAAREVAATDYAYLANETIDELVTALSTIDRTRAAVVAEVRRRREAIDQALKGLDQPPERAVG